MVTGMEDATSWTCRPPASESLERPTNVTSGTTQGNTDLVHTEATTQRHAHRHPLHLQVGLFLVVGGAQLVVDWVTFVLLTKIGVGSIASNLAGRLTGACLGFFLNGRLTFPHMRKAKSITSRSALRFAGFWIAASLVSTTAVYALNSYAGLKAAWLGKPIIEAILAIISFLCSKFWIYRH